MNVLHILTLPIASGLTRERKAIAKKKASMPRSRTDWPQLIEAIRINSITYTEHAASQITRQCLCKALR